MKMLYQPVRRVGNNLTSVSHLPVIRVESTLGSISILRSPHYVRLRNLLCTATPVMNAKLGWLLKSILYVIVEVEPNVEGFCFSRRHYQGIGPSPSRVVCVRDASSSQFDTSNGNRRIGRIGDLNSRRIPSLPNQWMACLDVNDYTRSACSSER